MKQKKESFSVIRARVLGMIHNLDDSVINLAGESYQKLLPIVSTFDGDVIVKLIEDLKITLYKCRKHTTRIKEK